MAASSHANSRSARPGESGGDVLTAQTMCGKRWSEHEVFTLPRRLLDLPGPIALSFNYSYSSLATSDVGLGHGWSHTFSWLLTVTRRKVLVRTPFGGTVAFDFAKAGQAVMGTGGWVLVQQADGSYNLDTNDGFLHQFTRLAHDETKFLLTRIQHRNTANISLYYGPRGDLRVMFDSVGRRIDFTSTAEGRIASFSITDPKTRQTITFGRFGYDSRGNLTSATNADQETVVYGYADSDSLLTHYTLPSGLTFYFVYDSLRRGVETWGTYTNGPDPALDDDLPPFLADGTTRAKGIYHVKLTFGSDGFSEVVDSTRVQRFFANEHGQIQKAVGNGGVTDRVFDDVANMVEHTDAAGATTKYERDVRGNLLSETDALGRTFRIIRDETGLVVKNIDYAGNVIESIRDQDGNPLQVVTQTGSVTSYAYNDLGQVTERIEPNGGKTVFGGDAHENLNLMTTADGATWRWTWDFFGRPIERIDPAGAVTGYSYSDAGRLLRIAEPGGRTVYLERDRMGNLSALTDASGTTRWAWGGLNWLVSQTFPDGSQVNFRYNRHGWLTKMLNERGQELRIQHDTTGQIERLRSFDRSELKNKYDAMLRPVQQENSLRERLEITYDVIGRPTDYEYADQTKEVVVYDVRDEIAAIDGPGASVRYDRNAVGSIVRETTTIEGETFVIEATVDAMERRVQIRSSLGFKQDIQRDVMTRVAETVLNDSYRIRMRRDVRGLLLSQLLPYGGSIDSQYDERYRLIRRRAATQPQGRVVGPQEPEWMGEGRDGLTVDHAYHYSLDEDLIELWDRDEGTTKFEYDLRHRLQRKEPEKRPNAAEVFRHDETSNVYEAGTARAYDPGNRLLHKDATEYIWNDAGRLIEKRRKVSPDQVEVWRYEWNGQGLLSAVIRPDGLHVEFLYDPFARRVLKRLARFDEAGQKTVESTTRFVWDRAFLLHEVRDVTVGDAIQRRIRSYCYDETSLTPLAHRDEVPGQAPGEWFHYVCDVIDTPEQLVAGDGTVAGRLEHSAYGVTRVAPGSRTSTSLRFQGQYYDEETGLAYNHHRYYDPEQCRYIRPDPIGAASSLTNFFQYTINPVGYCDPLGLEHQAKTTFQPAGSKETFKPVGDNVLPGGVVTSGWSSDGVVRNIPGAEGDRGNSTAPRPDEHGNTTTRNQSQSTAHTERHAMEWAERNFEPHELKGGQLAMGGQLPPCPSCSRAMREWSDRTGCKVDYSWPRGQSVAYHPHAPDSPKSGGPGTDAFCKDYHRDYGERDNTATARYHAEQNDMRRTGLHPDNQKLNDPAKDSNGLTVAQRVQMANQQPMSQRI